MVKQYAKFQSPLFFISRQETKGSKGIFSGFLILLFLMGLNVSFGQTSTQNFGTGTASHTSSTGSTGVIPNPTPTSSGTTWVRGGATVPNGPIVLANTSPTPNLLGTTGSYVRAVASTSTSVAKFSPWVAYPSGQEFYTSFKVLFGDSAGGNTATSGIWNFYQGAGSMYSDASDFTGAQVFTGLRFTYAASGVINITNRAGGAFNNTGISPSTLSQGTAYTIEIVGNNKTGGSGTINYTYSGISRSVAIQKFDLYVNGTLIGDDLSASQLSAGASIASGTFIGISSTSNVANIFVDDAITYNAVPASLGTIPPTTIDLADNGTQVAASNIDRGTTNVILNKIQLGVTTNDATLSGMTCTTAGTYSAADVSNLRVRYSADSTLDASIVTDPILSNLANPGVAGNKTFTSFVSKTITATTTGYLFITADVSATATIDNTISVNAIGSANLTISGATYTPTPSATAGGVQTFKDLTAPTLTTLSPANGAIDVALATNLVLTFSENVKAGSGTISIYDATDTLFESFASNSGLITYSGATATINPTANLAYGTTYYVTVDNGAITDINNLAYAGFSTNATWSFATIAEPPVNDLCSSPTALTIGVTNSAGTFLNATPDFNISPDMDPSRDVWYTFTPTCSGSHTIAVNFAGTNGEDINFEVYTACTTTSTSGMVLFAGSNQPTDETGSFSAVSGTQYFIRVVDISTVATTFDITVDTAVTPSILLTNTGTPAAGNIAAGANNTVLFGFALAPSACNSLFTFSSADIFQINSDADNGDLSNFRLIVDSNNNGLAESGEISSFIGSASLTSGHLLFSSLGQTLTAGTTTRYLLIADVSSGAVNGRTFQVSLDESDVAASQTVSGLSVGEVKTITSTSIAIANNAQVTAGNILRGTNNTVISKAKLTVGGQTASVTQIDFVTAGSAGAYVQADIATNGFKLWRTTSSTVLDTNTDLLVGSVSSSKGATATNNDILSFTVTESLPVGDYYYWLTVDVLSSATPTHTITVNGLSNASVTSAGTTITGSTTTAGTQTIISPTLTIANNTVVPAGAILVSTSDALVARASLTPSNSNVNVTDINFVTAGNASGYTNSDVTTFKLWKNTTNDFSTASAFGTTQSSTKTVATDTETITFTDSQSLTSGTTYYLWLTADVSSSATPGKIITVNGLSNSSISSSTIGIFITGSSSASGNQTIQDNAPTLTAAVSATVDNPFTVTFTDNANWRAAISSITVGAIALSPSAYTITAGQIEFNPSNDTKLQSVGSKAIVVIAANYINDVPTHKGAVSQTIDAGVVKKLAITTALPASVSNGAVFSPQPVLSYRDQYDNPRTSSETVRATKLDAGSWTLGGTTDITPGAASGSVTYTNLTATSAATVSGAQIRFSLPNVLGSLTVDSATFTILGPDFRAITAYGTPVTENFDGLLTSATAALPIGFVVSGGVVFTGGTALTTVVYGTSGAGIITSTSGGGTVNWANGVAASATDRSLGFITSGSFSSPRSIMAKFKNTTGGDINSLSIVFDYEKYRSGSRAFDWTFFKSFDGISWTAETGGNQSYLADANNTVVSNPPLSTTKTFSISGLTLANGDTVYLRWTYTGVGGATNAQGMGVDNLSVTGCQTLLASVTAGTSPICSGNTASFTLTGTPGALVTYASGSTTLDGSGSATVNITNAVGDQSIVLQSVSKNGCSNSVTGSATVIVNLTSTPTVNLTSSDADNSFCTGTNVTFTATPANLGGGSVANYDFKVNGGSVQNTASNTYATSALTTGQLVTVDITVSGGTCLTATTANSNTINNTVNALPIVTAANVSGCSGTPIALSGTPIGGTFSVANPYTGPDTTYTHTFTDGNGCSATSASATITNTSQPEWYLDADNDLYYTGSAVVQCTSPGAGYTTATLTGGGDCADGNSAINPGVTEVCYNNIDDNCNLTLSEGCAAVPVNMTASYNGTTLPSLATAIPAVAYTYLSVTNLKYRFSITNVTTGVTSSDIIQSSRYVTIPAALHSSPGVYTIKASAVINDEIVAYSGNTVTVNAPNIPKITLAPGSCGATLAALTSTLTANAGLNATGYTFRIRLTSDNGPTPTYGTSSSSTRFVSANSFTGFPLSYGTSYQVAVQYSYTDPVTTLPAQSGYGAECTVVTPSIPTTSLASPTCGSQVATLNANISAAAASYAVNYQFRIRKTSDVGGPYTESAPNASRFSSLTAFGLTLAYNTQYSISVRYSVLVNGSPVWSNYGSECIVKTPFFPTTSLVQSQCGLEAATTLTQQLNIIPYPGFPNYKVRLQEVIGEDLGEPQDIVVTYPYFRLSQFSTAELGKNYNVSVAIKLGNVFGDFSTECDIHTPEAARTIKMPFTATAYPNPFANNFMIDVKTKSQSSVNLKVYDMVGRLIEQRDVRVSDMETTTIGERYPSGIYNVVVSQEDTVETLRVVKR